MNTPNTIQQAVVYGLPDKADMKAMGEAETFRFGYQQAFQGNPAVYLGAHVGAFQSGCYHGQGVRTMQQERDDARTEAEALRKQRDGLVNAIKLLRSELKAAKNAAYGRFGTGQVDALKAGQALNGDTGVLHNVTVRKWKGDFNVTSKPARKQPLVPARVFTVGETVYSTVHKQFAKFSNIDSMDVVALTLASGQPGFSHVDRLLKAEPIPREADKMTVDEFQDAVASGLFTSDDGTGYYASDKLMVRGLRVDLSNIRKDFTHVVWFNK